MTSLTKQDLVEEFSSLGVSRGNTVMVHSSYKSLGGVEGGPQTVVDALLEVLGPFGTLMMPTFNFGFCRGEGFDARTTPSEMGILTELARTDSYATRVLHPVHSFAVLGGGHAWECRDIRNVSSYGPDSIFSRFLEWNGKILVIGVDWTNSVTLLHHVEEMEGCDYRFLKAFKGPYTDLDGITRDRWFCLLVYDYDKYPDIHTETEPFGEYAEQLGVVTVKQIGGATCRLMGARDIYRLAASEWAAGRHMIAAGR